MMSQINLLKNKINTIHIWYKNKNLHTPINLTLTITIIRKVMGGGGGGVSISNVYDYFFKIFLGGHKKRGQKIFPD
jgi:hypothetical protein